MQFRKCTAILLIVFILFSNLGLAFNVHYCHDEISGISINIDEKEICEEKIKTCCSATYQHNDCCSNKELKTEKKTDNVVTKSFQLDLQQYYLVSVFQSQKAFDRFNKSPNRLFSFYCDSNAPPLYKLHCQLVFYA